jgi:hypothetical protein
VTSASDGADPNFVCIGHADDLATFLAEYGLERDDIQGLVTERFPPGAGGQPGPPEYLVHRSVLRSHGEFPCAGDAEALAFCRRVAAEMAALFGISRREAVARVNRHWSQAGPDGRAPRVWIVGLDLVYHEEPRKWARRIYYRPDYQWRAPGQEPTPLPPPSRPAVRTRASDQPGWRRQRRGHQIVI